MTVIVYNDHMQVVGQHSASLKMMVVYLLDESSSLERALVTTPIRPETQRCLIWRAFASQGSSRGVIMGVRFLMTSTT